MVLIVTLHLKSHLSCYYSNNVSGFNFKEVEYCYCCYCVSILKDEFFLYVQLYCLPIYMQLQELVMNTVYSLLMVGDLNYKLIDSRLVKLFKYYQHVLFLNGHQVYCVFQVIKVKALIIFFTKSIMAIKAVTLINSCSKTMVKLYPVIVKFHYYFHCLPSMKNSRVYQLYIAKDVTEHYFQQLQILFSFKIVLEISLNVLEMIIRHQLMNCSFFKKLKFLVILYFIFYLDH